VSAHDARAANGERWLPVPGYEGRYEVSDLGRVRGQRGHRKPWIAGKGYLYLSLHRGRGTRKNFTIHQLVLLAFVGPRRLDQECRHLDGNKLNNRLANLAWGTASENELDKVRHGTHRYASRTHCLHGHTDWVVEARGSRRCRTCHNEWDRAARRRVAAVAGRSQ